MARSKHHKKPYQNPKSTKSTSQTPRNSKTTSQASSSTKTTSKLPPHLRILLGAKKIRGSFMDLPAEIRNDIYHLALIQTYPIVIHDMHPEKRRQGVKEGRCDREPYWSKDNDGSTGDYELTTYCIKRMEHYELSGVGLISANRQIRSEASAIFYGENTFAFESMNAVVPFLKDRAPEHQGKITSLGLLFRSHRTFNRRCYTSNELYQICVKITKMKCLQMKRLMIIFDERIRDFFRFSSEDVGVEAYKGVEWMQPLAEEINDLEELSMRFLDSRRVPSSEPGRLWRSLARKMLNRDGGKVDEMSFQYPRIHHTLGSYGNEWAPVKSMDPRDGEWPPEDDEYWNSATS